APNRLSHKIKIPAIAAGYAAHRSDGCVQHDVLKRLACRVRMRNADCHKVRIACEVIAVIEHHVHSDMARKGKLAPLADTHRLIRADDLSVAIDPAERNLVDDLGRS